MDTEGPSALIWGLSLALAGALLFAYALGAPHGKVLGLLALPASGACIGAAGAFKIGSDNPLLHAIGGAIILPIVILLIYWL
jgi:hypothetical protein